MPLTATPPHGWKSAPGMRERPPSAAVSTHTPSSSRAKVCSTCTAGEPSTVTTVQPSSSSAVSRLPRVSIGSIAKHQTGHQPRPSAGTAVVEQVWVLVHLGADAVPAVLSDDAVPTAPAGPTPLRFRLQPAHLALDGVGDVGQPAAPGRQPVGGRGDPRPHRRLGYLRHPGHSRVDLSHRHGDRGVSVPAVHDRAAVDGDDVALTQHLLRRRDGVHHLLVDRGAERRRDSRGSP